MLDVDFLGLGFEEKLCFIFGHTHKCLDFVIWSRNDQNMFPQMKGSTCWKKIRTSAYHLDNQTCFALWKKCQQLKHEQNLTLDKMGWEWNLLDTLCKKVHHTSIAKINAHKKMKKSIVTQDPTFSNLKFMDKTSHHFRFWLLTFLGLEFGL